MHGAGRRPMRPFGSGTARSGTAFWDLAIVFSDERVARDSRSLFRRHVWSRACMCLTVALVRARARCASGAAPPGRSQRPSPATSSASRRYEVCVEPCHESFRQPPWRWNRWIPLHGRQRGVSQERIGCHGATLLADARNSMDEIGIEVRF